MNRYSRCWYSCTICNILLTLSAFLGYKSASSRCARAGFPKTALCGARKDYRLMRRAWALIAIAFFGACCVQAAQQGAPGSTPASSPSAQYRAVLNRYCVTCHNEKLKTADLMLDKTAVEDPTVSPEVWEKVVRKLRTGAMPPPGAPRPEKTFYEGFASYLETALDRAAVATPDPGRPVVHRLNRAEYTNAVRDLLAVDIDAAQLLPADDSGRGFDNLASLLTVSPVLMERYLSAAAAISSLAVGDRSIRAAAETYRLPEKMAQDDRENDDLPFGSRGGIAVRHPFPLDGEYVIKIRLVRNGDEYIRGLLGEPHQLDVRLDGAKVKQFSVGGERHGATGPLHTRNGQYYESETSQQVYEYFGDSSLEVRFPAKAGTHLVQVAFRQKTYEPEGILEIAPPHDTEREDIDDYKGGDPAVESITITGPYEVKGPGETASRRKIFACGPGAAPGRAQLISLGAGANGGSDEEACAKKILSTLARRAYRRPVTEADVQPLLSLYRVGRNQATFDAGIQVALQRILAGPEFLFRIEHDPANMTPNTAYRISDLELASRLSFFLWSSIPDDELLDLAERGKLKDPKVLEQQVRRMMADERSSAMVENFGGQWLLIRNMRQVSPDPNLFPEFDDELRQAFERETELFLESNVREDRSVVELLNANYTFVNARLAELYGIPDIYGSNFRRVTVTDENRLGLLGQGSILTVTSRANRTSPVLRGKWVLQNLLGTPPPPPPPDVPPLKEKGPDIQNLTMRQRMEAHRANPTCANCHARMDPIGFALDSFNGIGKFRTTDGNNPLDVSGTLPDGVKFQGPAELRKLLLSRSDQFVYTVTERLLTYALGRETDFYDAPAIRKIIRDSAAGNYRWSSLILGIVKSTPFQMRKTPEPATTAGLP